MLRIVRSVDGGAAILGVSGQIGSGQRPELRQPVEDARGQVVVLDMVPGDRHIDARRSGGMYVTRTRS